MEKSQKNQQKQGQSMEQKLQKQSAFLKNFRASLPLLGAAVAIAVFPKMVPILRDNIFDSTYFQELNKEYIFNQYLRLKIFSLAIFPFLAVQIFSLIVSFLANFLRTFNQEENKFQASISRSIRNSFEQGFVYIFVLFYYCQVGMNYDWIDAARVLAFGIIFAVARFFYLITYVLGVKIVMPEIRSIFVVLYTIVTAILIAESFGVQYVRQNYV